MEYKNCKSADISAFVADMTRLALQSGQSAVLGLTEEATDKPAPAIDLTYGLFQLHSLSSMIKAAWAGLEQGWDEADARAVSAHYRIAEKSLQELTRRLFDDVRSDNCALLEAYLARTKHYVGSDEPVCIVGRKLVTAGAQADSLHFCLLSAISLRTNYALPAADVSPAVLEHVEATFLRLAQVPGLQVRMHPKLLTPTQVYGLRMNEVYRMTGGQAPQAWGQAHASDCRDSNQPGVNGEDAVSTNTRFVALFVSMPVSASQALDRNFLNNPQAIAEWECLADILTSPEMDRVMVFPPLSYFNAISRAQVASVLTNMLPSLYPQVHQLGSAVKRLSFSVHREPDLATDIREVRLAFLGDQDKVLSTASFTPLQPLYTEVVQEGLNRLASLLKTPLSTGIAVLKAHPGSVFDGEKWVPTSIPQPLPLRA